MFYLHVMTLFSGSVFETDDIGGKNGNGGQEKDGRGHGCQAFFHGAFLLQKLKAQWSRRC